MGIALCLSTIPKVAITGKVINPFDYPEYCKKIGIVFYHGDKGDNPTIFDGEKYELIDIDTKEGKLRWEKLKEKNNERKD